MPEKDGQQQLEPLHLLAALVAQQDGVVPPLLSRLGVRPESLEAEIQTQLSAPAQSERRLAAVFEQGELTRFWKRRLKKPEKFKDEYVSAEHILLAIAARAKDPAGQLLSRHGASREAHSAGARLGARQPSRHVANAGIDLSRARAVCARPHGAGPARQARSGHRPRRGDSPRHADPGAAHQE